MAVKLTLIKAIWAVSLSLRFDAIIASREEHTNYPEKDFKLTYGVIFLSRSHFSTMLVQDLSQKQSQWNMDRGWNLTKT